MNPGIVIFLFCSTVLSGQNPHPEADKIEQCFERHRDYVPGFGAKSVADCNREALALAKTKSDDSQAVLEIGKVVFVKSMPVQAVAVFAELPFEKKPELCKHPQVQASMLVGLEHDALIGSRAKHIAKSCLGTVKVVLAEAMPNKSEQYRANVCPLLKGQGVLKGLQEKKCSSS